MANAADIVGDLASITALVSKFEEARKNYMNCVEEKLALQETFAEAESK